MPKTKKALHSKEPLTSTQKERLTQAILLAKNSGDCLYVSNGKPGCVIGQLGAICGVPMEQLRTWDHPEKWPGVKKYFGASTVYSLMSQLGPKKLKEYPRSLLENLQGIWDDRLFIEDFKDKSVAVDHLKRMHMMFTVEAWGE